MTEETDYKAIDYARLRAYLAAQEGDVAVSDIKENSGANLLRVYPLLIEMELNGEIAVTQKGSLGAPLRVQLVR